MLQIADETLIVGDASWKNMWSIKVVFHLFELVSGLNVNFHKSNILGFNMDSNFVNDCI